VLLDELAESRTGGAMTVVGGLTPEQIELLFAHMPVGFSFADEEDIVRFWAGEGFSVCDPQFVGRSLYDCHPKHTHAALESLLADFKSGRKDRVERIEHRENGLERLTYTALRDAHGTYRGVRETIVPLSGVVDDDDEV
jgi:uncharacterized protein